MFLLIFGACALAALVLALVLRPFVARLLEGAGDAARREGARTSAEAKRFALWHGQAECLPEAFRRLAACDGFWCQASAPDFAKRCLHGARPSPNLCDEVPRSLALAAIWPAQKCLGVSASPPVCRRIYGELVMACSKP
ncbi:MAG TPA: hypothetical protein VEI82_04250 [Myxococcota bacterium]|nr:hypothetical protein [Myxococcota bacterium]